MPEEIELIKVTGKGQVHIPKKMREELNIEPGDHLVVRIERGKISLQKISKEDIMKALR